MRSHPSSADQGHLPCEWTNSPAKFQQALADAQSLAVGRDHQFIEPAHVHAGAAGPAGRQRAPAAREGGRRTSTSCAPSSARCWTGCRASKARPAKCTSRTTCNRAAQRHRQARAAARRPVHLQRAVRARGARRQGPARQGAEGRRRRASGAIEKAIDEVRGGEKVDDPNAEESRQALEKYTIDLTERAESGKLDPVIGRDDEIRRTDPGAAAPHEEQPRAHRRARRRQDRDRRRPRAAHRQRRSARRA